MIKNGYDQPEAIIIGGFYTAWQVYYDGRPQGAKEYADTPEEAEQAGQAAIDTLKSTHCGYPCYLYQDNALWTIRVWD